MPLAPLEVCMAVECLVSYHIRGFLLLLRRRNRFFSTGCHFDHETPYRHLSDWFGRDPAHGRWLLKYDSVARCFPPWAGRLSAICGPDVRSLPVARSRAPGCWRSTTLLPGSGYESCAGSDLYTATTTSRLSLAVGSQTRPFRCIVKGVVNFYRLFCSTPLLTLIPSVFFDCGETTRKRPRNGTWCAPAAPK
jgi:hypothetical protein